VDLQSPPLARDVMAKAAITDEIHGKYCLVTGAGTSLGREIGRSLARLGGHVILTSHDFGLAEDARSSIVSQQPSAQALAMTLDLSKRMSINEFGEMLHERVPQLDVVLGPYILLRRLQDLLKAAAPSRIINVVSPFAGGLNFDDPDFDTHAYNGIKAYRASMQAARLLSYAAGAQMAIHGVTVNAAVPGTVRGDPGAGMVSGMFARSAEQAADRRRPQRAAARGAASQRRGRAGLRRARRGRSRRAPPARPAVLARRRGRSPRSAARRAGRGRDRDPGRHAVRAVRRVGDRGGAEAVAHRRSAPTRRCRRPGTRSRW
jgi:NAD(P)-dependent dehydrogenase (short-subunit alcohol dehydrogenase family)